MKQRLIFVPQYPAEMRYQEWWLTEFIKKLVPEFDVHILGEAHRFVKNDPGGFSNIKEATKFEASQIKEYMDLKLCEDDILLLNDISFPGLFAQALFLKRPKKCFAICHATSKNIFDIFAFDRKIKYPIEKSVGKLFQKVIVGSYYHKAKLGWKNIEVLPLPFPAFSGAKTDKLINIISAARNSPQKITPSLERFVEDTLFTQIKRPTDMAKNWNTYYNYLAMSKCLFISSKEETFGYQVYDAILNDCVPIAPNKFSFPELLPPEYLYNNPLEACDMVHAVINGYLKTPRALTTDASYKFFPDLIKILKS